MIEFLGRTAELAIMRDAIEDTGERTIFVISGPGGIGKTRLLQEIGSIVYTSSNVRVLDVIDFDLPMYEIPQIIGRAIALQFPAAFFTAYLEAIYLRQMAEEGGIDPVRLAAQTLDVNRKFIECFNHAAANTRVVLRFDTIEKMQGRIGFNRLLDILFQLHNIVVIFAGRPTWEDGMPGTDALFEHLDQRNDGRINLKHLQLQPLDQASLQLYVAQKQANLGIQLSELAREALTILAAGRPVLIDLAVEHGLQANASTWLNELIQSLPQLRYLQGSAQIEDRQTFATMQQRFDHELVADIGRLRNDIDRLTFLLALIAPLDQDSIATILGLSHEQAATLFDDASSRVSFKIIDKVLIQLHDAVRTLLLTYVLPESDADGQHQITFLTRAIEAFENQSHAILARIGRLRADEEVARTNGDLERGLQLFEARAHQQRQHQQTRLRIVECAFRLDPLMGAERLERELEIARLHGGTGVDLSAIFSTIRIYFPELERRSLPHYIRAQMALANQQIADGQYQLAEEIFNLLDQQTTVDSTQRFDILHGHGNVQMGIGKAQAALQCYQNAANLAQQINNNLLLSRALLSSAWAARLQGQLDAAIIYYQRAFGLSIRAGLLPEEALSRRAIALNGMAYIYAIQGKKRRTAIDTLHQAIDIRQNLGESSRFALGQSYTTAGEVYLHLEQPYEALKYLALADDLFATLGAHGPTNGKQRSKQYNQWIAKIASARGRAYRDIAEETVEHAARRAYLQRAETELLKAIELAIAADLPLARYRLASVYACTIASRPQAVQTWHTSYQDAQNVGDIATELFSICQLARMQIYGIDTGYPNYQALAAWLDAYHERNPHAAFQIAEGRFTTYLGCLALQVGDVESAIPYFQTGLGVLVEQAKHRLFSFAWHLHFLEQDVLPTCATAQIRTVWSSILDGWMEQCKGVEAWTTFERWQHWPE